MLTIIGPPGLGDLAWVYAKFCDIAKRRQITFKIADLEPQRSFDFVEILPNIINGGYTKWENWERYADKSISIDTNLEELADGEYYVQCNKGLESGKKLSEIFPHQSTNFHFELNITDEDKATATSYVESGNGWPLIGVYASSYHAHDNAWTEDEWVEFLTKVREEFPNACFFMIGATWDKKSVDVYERLKKEDWNVVSSIGQHKIGITLSVIKQLDYLFAYPSGLGIMADVMNVPCLMWYWNNQSQDFLNTYPDQSHVESGFHINIPFGKVDEALNAFNENGKSFIKQR